MQPEKCYGGMENNTNQIASQQYAFSKHTYNRINLLIISYALLINVLVDTDGTFRSHFVQTRLLGLYSTNQSPYRPHGSAQSSRIMHSGPDEKQIAQDRRIANWTVTPERSATGRTHKAREVTRRHSETSKPRPRWRSLFAFTTKKHTLPLCLALLLSMGSGIVSPLLAIFLGRIFDAFTNFGSGTLGEDEFRNDISTYSSYLAGLGLASWLLNGTFFMSWLAFGEVQARTCRGRIFNGLLDKPTEWYDTKKSGIGALVPRLQT